MSFVVLANSRRPGAGAFQAVKLTRKDAVLTAVSLVGQGMDGVTITDEDGRVYGPTEFRRSSKTTNRQNFGARTPLALADAGARSVAPEKPYAPPHRLRAIADPPGDGLCTDWATPLRRICLLIPRTRP